VEHLEPRRDIDDAHKIARQLTFLKGVESVAAGADRIPAPVTEQRTESLTPTKKGSRIFDERTQLGCYRRKLGGALGEELIERNADEID
jgi:hypothetical protein